MLYRCSRISIEKKTTKLRCLRNASADQARARTHFGATQVEIRLMTVVKKEVIVVAKEDMLFSSTII